MKVLATIFLTLLCSLLFAVSCKNDRRQIYRDGTTGRKFDPVLEKKYQSVLSVLTNSCLTSGCHVNGKIIDMTSASKFKASERQVKARVSGGTMPPPNSGPGQAFSVTKKATILSFFN